MKEAETGKEKVQKICDILRKKTLEPAHEEAEEIIAEAREKAEAILKEGRESVAKMVEEATREIEQKENVFRSSLNQACKQSLEALKEAIETKLFNQELEELILKETKDPQIIVKMVQALLSALEKEGIDADLSVYIPASIPARTVNALLSEQILSKLREKSVLLRDIGGGIEVKLHHKNITLDMTDKALKELVASYIRKDFRTLIFQS